ncbi:MAG: hypothetical protein GY711_28090 [bacterium]|nr:hypothetical protein [bacterium]
MGDAEFDLGLVDEVRVTSGRIVDLIETELPFGTVDQGTTGSLTVKDRLVRSTLSSAKLVHRRAR